MAFIKQQRIKKLRIETKTAGLCEITECDNIMYFCNEYGVTITYLDNKIEGSKIREQFYPLHEVIAIEIAYEEVKKVF